MERMTEILNEIAQAAGEKFGGKKRSELKDSDFLFPATKSFPIVTPADIPDAISNFGRMKGQMSYEAFLRKLYNMAKRKGPEFVAALPEASKEQLGIKKKVKADSYNDINEFELGPSTMKNLDDLYGDDEENTKLNDTNAVLSHLNSMQTYAENMTNKIKAGQLTEKHLTYANMGGKICGMCKTFGQMHDFIMNMPLADDDKTLIANLPNTDVDTTDLPIDTQSGSKPGLWDNIRKKKEREGKNYKPAKPGDKDRPDPDQWKKLTKKTK